MPTESIHVLVHLLHGQHDEVVLLSPEEIVKNYVGNAVFCELTAGSGREVATYSKMTLQQYLLPIIEQGQGDVAHQVHHEHGVQHYLLLGVLRTSTLTSSSFFIKQQEN